MYNTNDRWEGLDVGIMRAKFKCTNCKYFEIEIIIHDKKEYEKYKICVN